MIGSEGTLGLITGKYFELKKEKKENWKAWANIGKDKMSLEVYIHRSVQGKPHL